MWLIDGIVAGLIAGIFMGLLSQLGYWLGIVRSHLIVIDGASALHMIKQEGGTAITYTVGIIIHLTTSVVFGVIYVVIAKVADFDIQQVVPIVVYVFILWLAMLAVALPIAGQGFMGNKIRKNVWLEQLVLHIIFGFGFWWALGIA
jgi:uncharacterized membrane protein YagU involved in acid resistance